jgi:hypothetical protein
LKFKNGIFLRILSGKVEESEWEKFHVFLLEIPFVFRWGLGGVSEGWFPSKFSEIRNPRMSLRVVRKVSRKAYTTPSKTSQILKVI